MPADAGTRGAAEGILGISEDLPPWLILGVLGSVATAVFVIRLTGLPNLMDNEYRLGATVLNVLQEGNCNRPTMSWPEH